MRWRVTTLILPCVGLLVSLFACSPAGVRHETSGGGGSNQGAGGLSVTLGGSVGVGVGGLTGLGCDPTVPGSPCSPDAAAPPGCGDGMLTDDEACDDGNRAENDGCQGNCLATLPGYS